MWPLEWLYASSLGSIDRILVSTANRNMEATEEEFIEVLKNQNFFEMFVVTTVFKSNSDRNVRDFGKATSHTTECSRLAVNTPTKALYSHAT